MSHTKRRVEAGQVIEYTEHVVSSQSIADIQTLRDEKQAMADADILRFDVRTVAQLRTDTVGLSDEAYEAAIRRWLVCEPYRTERKAMLDAVLALDTLLNEVKE